MKFPRVAVMGAGSWGTTVAKILADAAPDREVALWARRPEVAAQINEHHEHKDYLPGVLLPDQVVAYSDPNAALRGATLVALAVPSQTLRANLASWRFEPDVTLVSLAKGIELGTTLRMSEVIAEVTGLPSTRIAVLSGPNLAGEIAHGQPTATVIACVDETEAVRVQHAVLTPYFRAYTNTDVVGCELGGALKNVIALAVGMASGMGFGYNTQAALITRGLAEIERLGVALGAQPATFGGLAGLGDLAATCLSPASRNHHFGLCLGQGLTPAEAQKRVGQTAEGVRSAPAILALARAHNVELPITEQVELVCHHDVPVRAVVQALMERLPRPERVQPNS